MDYESFCSVCKKDVHCCIFENDKGFTFVSPDDAKRIKKKTGKQYALFLDHSPLPRKIVDSLKDEDPALEGFLRYKQLDKNNRLLRLKKKDDGRCIFLDDKGRCDIYSIRPNVCRIFPFWAMRLDNGRVKVIEHDADPGCMIMKAILKKGGIDIVLSPDEKAKIKDLFRKLEEEAITYKIEIKRLPIDIGE